MQKNREQDFKQMLEIVCDKTGMTVFDVLSKSRKRECVDARKYLLLLSQEEKIGITTLGLAELIQKRSHSAVVHAIKKAKIFIETDKHFKWTYSLIKNEWKIRTTLNYENIPQL